MDAGDLESPEMDAGWTRVVMGHNAERGHLDHAARNAGTSIATAPSAANLDHAARNAGSSPAAVPRAE